MYMESHAENNNITIKFSFQKFFNELQIPGCMKVYQVQYAFYNYSNSSQINKIFFFESLCHDQLFLTPCTIQPMEFSRPEHWSG